MKRSLIFASLGISLLFLACRSPQNESPTDASLTIGSQTPVHYDTPAFSADFPPGATVEIERYGAVSGYKAHSPDGSLFSVSYSNFPKGFPPNIDNLIDKMDNDMFKPGHSLAKKDGKLSGLPAVTAVIAGVARTDGASLEANTVLAWSESQHRLWMVQTVTTPGVLSAEKASRFIESVRIK